MNLSRVLFCLLPLFTTLLAAESSTEKRPPAADPTGNADDEKKAGTGAETDFVFGWGSVPLERAKPRGGTSEGAPFTLAPPVALPLPAVTSAQDDHARDRAAILALAGEFRVSFHFLESVGLTEDFRPDRPYHSWATERVHVLEDSGDRIRLQHTLEMHFQEKDGETPEPSLVKHWRQDWTYQDRDLHTFRGDSTWTRRRPSEAEVKGTWSQTVTGVEDSPRYEALGRWEHRGNLSVWTSETFWRPLPRREHSARKDYTVLEGIHRLIITPTGWLHEQQNWKRVAGEGGAPSYLSGEIGLDRYERISAPSLTMSAEYWERTGPFWAVVRQVWDEILSERDTVRLKNKVGGESLYEPLFEYAETIGSEGHPFDPAEAEKKVREWISAHLEDNK